MKQLAISALEAAKAIRWTSKTLSVEAKSWLANLPSRQEFTLGNIRVGVIHGSPKRP